MEIFPDTSNKIYADTGDRPRLAEEFVKQIIPKIKDNNLPIKVDVVTLDHIMISGIKPIGTNNITYTYHVVDSEANFTHLTMDFLERPTVMGVITITSYEEMNFYYLISSIVNQILALVSYSSKIEHDSDWLNKLRKLGIFVEDSPYGNKVSATINTHTLSYGSPDKRMNLLSTIIVHENYTDDYILINYIETDGNRIESYLLSIALIAYKYQDNKAIKIPLYTDNISDFFTKLLIVSTHSAYREFHNLFQSDKLCKLTPFEVNITIGEGVNMYDSCVIISKENKDILAECMRDILE